jgi:hypothetical protein
MMDRNTGRIYQNTVHLTWGALAGMTCPGVVC